MYDIISRRNKVSRCLSCNQILTPWEDKKKYKDPPHEYIQLCTGCFQEVKEDFIHSYIYEEGDEVEQIEEAQEELL